MKFWIADHDFGYTNSNGVGTVVSKLKYVFSFSMAGSRDLSYSFVLIRRCYQTDYRFDTLERILS